VERVEEKVGIQLHAERIELGLRKLFLELARSRLKPLSLFLPLFLLYRTYANEGVQG